MKNKIGVIGLGYVGCSLAALFSKENDVIAYDIDKQKVEKINKRSSPIIDQDINEYLKDENLSLTASCDFSHLKNCQFIFICTPTDYDENSNFFNTDSIDDCIAKVEKLSIKTTLVIKSTIPIGYTAKMKSIYPDLDIVFSPEFLREGKALFDNLYPSRIIVSEGKNSESVLNLFKEAALKDSIPTQLCGSTEAEAIKLFSNTYLAMRVAFFNELDSFTMNKDLSAKQIIDGISADPRIGSDYNNPSFGYGGYCLPKDTKQLLANYSDIPQKMIRATIESNDLRKKLISKCIKDIGAKNIGIYKIAMKEGSDNYRSSSMLDVIENLNQEGLNVFVYEPLIKNENTEFQMIKNLEDFKTRCDLIVCNRFSSELDDVKHKTFTRDIYGVN